MGWLFYHRPRGESDRAHFQRKLFDGRGEEIVECHSTLSTFYAAVRNPSNGTVWAAVILTRRVRDYYNFGYKDMTETMGRSWPRPRRGCSTRSARPTTSSPWIGVPAAAPTSHCGTEHVPSPQAP